MLYRTGTEIQITLKNVVAKGHFFYFFWRTIEKEEKNSNLDMIQIGLRYRKHIRKCFSMSFRDQDGLF